MNKILKIGIVVFLLFILIGGYIFYQTHKSVEQVLNKDEEELKDILQSTTQTSNPQNNSNSITKAQNNVEENISIQNNSIDNEPIQENQQGAETPIILKSGEFDPGAQDSDRFHKGWGNVQILNFKGEHKIVFADDFKVTNGPDYKLYLVKEENVETENFFEQIKEDSYQIAEIKQFSGFSTYEIPEEIPLDEIKGVVIWCESFSEFITYANLT